MNKKLIDWWIGGASYTSEYQAVLDRATTLGYTLPSASIKTAQNALVVALKAAGIWTKLDILYVPANDVSSNFWKLNWISPSLYECTEPGGAVTKSSGGIKGNGSSTYASTNFTPSTQATKLTTSNGSQAIYLHTVPATGTILCGARNVAGTNPYLYFQYTNASSFTYRTLDDAGGNTYTGGTPSGSFLYAEITAADGYALYKNGVSVQSSSGATTLGLPTTPLFIGGSSGSTSFADAVIGFYAAGQILTGVQAGLYNAWASYKTALGI